MAGKVAGKGGDKVYSWADRAALKPKEGGKSSSKTKAKSQVTSAQPDNAKSAKALALVPVLEQSSQIAETSRQIDPVTRLG